MQTTLTEAEKILKDAYLNAAREALKEKKNLYNLNMLDVGNVVVLE